MDSNSKKLFKISKPYGYYIPDVNKTINEYDKALSNAKKIILQKEEKYNMLSNENQKLRENIKHLEETLKQLYLEMNLLEVPNINSVQEQIIINNFKGAISKNKDNKYEDITDSDFSENSPNKNNFKFNFNIRKNK